SFSTTSTASIESYTLSLHDALPIYISKAKLRRHWFWGILIIIWFSTLFGFFVDLNDNLGGIVGFEVNTFLQDYIGKIGTILLLLFGLITYLAIRFKLTFQSISNLFTVTKKKVKDEFSNEDEDEMAVAFDNNLSAEAEDMKSAFEINLDGSEDIDEDLSTTNNSTDSAFKVKVAKQEEVIEDVA